MNDATGLLYVVTLKVEADLRAAFEGYMATQHIRDVLATGCFVGARFLETGDGNYRVEYHARDREELTRYISRHAATLRADFVTRFPNGVSVNRDVWTVIASFEST